MKDIVRGGGESVVRMPIAKFNSFAGREASGSASNCTVLAASSSREETVPEHFLDIDVDRFCSRFMSKLDLFCVLHVRWCF
jgi:hypothetical protein